MQWDWGGEEAPKHAPVSPVHSTGQEVRAQKQGVGLAHFTLGWGSFLEGLLATGRYGALREIKEGPMAFRQASRWKMVDWVWRGFRGVAGSGYVQ